MRHPGAARKTGRRRAGLADHEQALRRLLERAADRARRPPPPAPAPPLARPRGRRRRPRGRAAGTTPRRSAGGRAPWRARRRTAPAPAPRRGPRRRSGSEARRAHVSRNPHFRRSASSSVTLRAGQRVGERDPGRAAAGADVDDRPVRARDQVGGAQRVVERASRGPRPGRGARSGRGRDRPQPSHRSRTDGCTPGRLSRRSAAGATTTNRFGSLPSLDVSTSGSSFSSSWTIRRSTARHRVELDPVAGGGRLLRAAAGERSRAQLRGARGTRPRRPRRASGPRPAPMADRVREVLERVDRLAVPADQDAEVGPDERRARAPRRSRRCAPSRARRSLRPCARAARGRCRAWLVSSSWRSAGEAGCSGTSAVATTDAGV